MLREARQPLKWDPFHDIIMTGDFNIDLIKMNSEAQKLQNVTVSHGMLQQVNRTKKV